MLISGGDPLTLSTEKLEWIVSSVRAVEHVDIVRIGTRVPVALPMRIDDELVQYAEALSPALYQYPFQSPERGDGRGHRGLQ